MQREVEEPEQTLWRIVQLHSVLYLRNMQFRDGHIDNYGMRKNGLGSYDLVLLGYHQVTFKEAVEAEVAFLQDVEKLASHWREDCKQIRRLAALVYNACWIFRGLCTLAGSSGLHARIVETEELLQKAASLVKGFGEFKTSQGAHSYEQGLQTMCADLSSKRREHAEEMANKLLFCFSLFLGLNMPPNLQKDEAMCNPHFDEQGVKLFCESAPQKHIGFQALTMMQHSCARQVVIPWEAMRDEEIFFQPPNLWLPDHVFALYITMAAQTHASCFGSMCEWQQ